MRRRFSHAPYTGDTISVVVQVPPQEIGYVNSVTEGHEGLALVRTLDENRGVIQFLVVPELMEIFEEFLDALKAEIPIRKAPDRYGQSFAKG